MTRRHTPTGEPMAWIRAVLAEVDGEGCRDWPFSLSPKGYGDVQYEGKVQRVGHVVLALSGRPRPSAAHHQLHSCDRPPCIAPWHLRWGTNAENRAESAARGRTSAGEHRPQAKLTAAAVIEIRESALSLSDLAAKYGVGESTISKARAGLTWKRVRSAVNA